MSARLVLLASMLVGCVEVRSEESAEERSPMLSPPSDAPAAASPSSSTRIAPSSAPLASPSSAASALPIAAPTPSTLPTTTASSASSPLASASVAASASVTLQPPCPSDMVLVDRFCVDRFEAHLARVGDDDQDLPHPHFERPERGVRYRARNALGAFPQAYISRVEAKAACMQAGKRLCSRREWQRACRHDAGHIWPYGGKGVRGRCNTGKPHLLSLKYPRVPGGLRYDEHFNDPLLDQEPGFLSKSGDFSDCTSPWGTFDMVGNLHEWVSDSVDEELVLALEQEPHERRKQPWRDGNGIFMGGFFSTTTEHGPGCAFVTIAHEPSYHDYSTGFRCCRKADLPAAPRSPRSSSPAPTRTEPSSAP